MHIQSRQAEQSLDLFCLDQGSPPAFQARATESFGIGKRVLFPAAAHLAALDVGKEIKRPSALHPTLQAVCEMQVKIGGGGSHQCRHGMIRPHVRSHAHAYVCHGTVPSVRRRHSVRSTMVLTLSVPQHG